MPFVSAAQRRYLYATHPEIAKRWSKETPKGTQLPEYIQDKEAALHACLHALAADPELPLLIARTYDFEKEAGLKEWWQRVKALTPQQRKEVLMHLGAGAARIPGRLAVRHPTAFMALQSGAENALTHGALHGGSGMLVGGLYGAGGALLPHAARKAGDVAAQIGAKIRQPVTAQKIRSALHGASNAYESVSANLGRTMPGML